MLSILPTVVIVTEWIGEKTGLIPEQSPAPLEEFIEEEIVEKESVNVREVTVVADDAKSSVEVKIDVDYDPILAGVVEEAVEDVAYENDKKLREQKRKSRECGHGGSIDCSLKNVNNPSKKAPDIKKAAENAVKQAKPQVEEQQPKVVLPYELDEYVNRLFIEEVRKGIFRRKESIKLDDKEFTKAQVVEQFKKAIQTGNSAHVTRSGGLRNDFEKITKSEELLKRLKQDVRQAAYKDGDFKKARGLINLEIGRGVIKKQVLDEMLKVLDQVEKALAPKKAELLMVARSEIKEENKIGEGDWGKVYDYKGGAAKLALDESYVDFLVEDGEVILSLTGLDGVPKFLGWVFDEKGMVVGYITEKIDDAEELDKTTKKLSFKELEKIKSLVKTALERGVAHKDLQLKNILVDKQGISHIADWGGSLVKNKLTEEEWKIAREKTLKDLEQLEKEIKNLQTEEERIEEEIIEKESVKVRESKILVPRIEYSFFDKLVKDSLESNSLPGVRDADDKKNLEDVIVSGKISVKALYNKLYNIINEDETLSADVKKQRLEALNFVFRKTVDWLIAQDVADLKLPYVAHDAKHSRTTVTDMIRILDALPQKTKSDLETKYGANYRELVMLLGFLHDVGYAKLNDDEPKGLHAPYGGDMVRNELRNELSTLFGIDLKGSKNGIDDFIDAITYHGSDKKGKDYKAASLKDNPLLLLMRLSDNLDITNNRLRAWQADPLFMRAVYKPWSDKKIRDYDKQLYELKDKLD